MIKPIVYNVACATEQPCNLYTQFQELLDSTKLSFPIHFLRSWTDNYLLDSWPLYVVWGWINKAKIQNISAHNLLSMVDDFNHDKIGIICYKEGSSLFWPVSATQFYFSHRDFCMSDGVFTGGLTVVPSGELDFFARSQFL